MATVHDEKAVSDDDTAASEHKLGVSEDETTKID